MRGRLRLQRVVLEEGGGDKRDREGLGGDKRDREGLGGDRRDREGLGVD